MPNKIVGKFALQDEAENLFLLNKATYKNLRTQALILPEEQRRITILRDALNTSEGLKVVSKKLNSEKLRALYVRNPLEMVMYYCFARNDVIDEKYNFESFLDLWARVNDNLNIEQEPIIVDDVITQRAITFGELKSFVEKLSAELPEDATEKNTRKTSNITVDIQNGLDSNNFINSATEKDFIDFFHRHCAKLAEASQTIRYYFAKYAYYFICKQIEEFKEILQFFSHGTTEGAWNNIKNHMSSKNDWSLYCTLFTYLGSSLYDITDENERKKAILTGLSQAFVLMGKPINDAEGLPIVGNNSLSQLKDKTAMFKNSNVASATKARIICQNKINDISEQDFDNYRIDYSQLYYLLFVVLTKNPKEPENPEINERYLRNIFVKGYDMSRSAILLFLASVKGGLANGVTEQNEDAPLVVSFKNLDLDRVNQILERVGYASLGDADIDDEYKEVDEFYRDYFEFFETTLTTGDDAVMEIGEFRELFNTDFLPFEMASNSAKKIVNELQKKRRRKS